MMTDLVVKHRMTDSRPDARMIPCRTAPPPPE